MHIQPAARIWGWRFSACVAALVGAASVARPAGSDPGTVEWMVAEYVRAWNAGDSEALGRMWMEDGELIDAQGNAVDRKALLAARLAQGKGERPVLSITVDEVRLVDPNVAVVDGESRLATPEGTAIQETRFTGVIVKRDGTWRIRLIRQLSSRGAEPAESLQDLAWLVGEWVGLGDGMRVHTTTEWDLDGEYLVSRSDYEPENGDAYESEVRVGWDPEARAIKSWYFDSRGLVSVATWNQDGDHWRIAIDGTQHDGQRMTGIMTITRVDDNSYLRTVSNLTIGGKALPDQERRVFRVAAQSVE